MFQSEEAIIDLFLLLGLMYYVDVIVWVLCTTSGSCLILKVPLPRFLIFSLVRSLRNIIDKASL